MLGSGLVVLSKVQEGKISVVALVSKDCQDKANAGEIIKTLAPLIEAKGGGKPDFAQCGGAKPEGWKEFIKALEATLQG